MDSLPIGVFDSGMGGLTVLRALKACLPGESFLYLGDTARLPYGTKSSATIVQYAVQSTQVLVQEGIKCLVVACNTASAIALNILRDQFAPLPVVGVIEPGAEAACQVSVGGRIAVIGTESTIRGGAYQRAIVQRRPDAQVVARACSLFVALAEEGLTQGAIATSIAHHYLHDVFAQTATAPDTLVLGCTHFPVLRETIGAVLGADVNIVDSAATTAAKVALMLRAQEAQESPNATRLLVTDNPDRFARVGELFLGERISAEQVELVELGTSKAQSRERT